MSDIINNSSISNAVVNVVRRYPLSSRPLDVSNSFVPVWKFEPHNLQLRLLQLLSLHSPSNFEDLNDQWQRWEEALFIRPFWQYNNRSGSVFSIDGRGLHFFPKLPAHYEWPDTPEFPVNSQVLYQEYSSNIHLYYSLFSNSTISQAWLQEVWIRSLQSTGFDPSRIVLLFSSANLRIVW